MSIDEIRDILYRYYDIEEEYADEEKGAYINSKWLSVGKIIEILEENS